ncbi:ribosome biogenesis GTPase YlqF [Trichothermofontia sp.]
MTSSPIQWYPGHIAKAEKALLDQLKRVDLILEVRDFRIPLATAHPKLPQWLGNRAHLLILNRMDMVPAAVQTQWLRWFQQRDIPAYATDARQGKGIPAILQAAHTVSVGINQRRQQRGMLPRPVRAVVIGFPNVGKSALINRLLKRRVVESARRPGVTRQLRWVRVSDQIELLDAPGILPAALRDQAAALNLAICDDIGEAAYDNQRVAAALVERLKHLQVVAPTLFPASPLTHRYGLDPASLTGESYLAQLAHDRHRGDIERTARELLNDFRRGVLGAIALELPVFS